MSLSAFTGFWTPLDSLNWFWDSSPFLGFSGFLELLVVFCMCGPCLDDVLLLFLGDVFVCDLLDVCVLRYPYDPMM